MFLTSTLTVGQLTFILRVCIQALSYGGAFLMGYIIVASAPRIAPLQTHDTLNRIVGRETAMKATRKWMINVFRGQNGAVKAKPPLVLAMMLFSAFSILVALTDIGFLGFYACNQIYTFLDRPASINNHESAQAMIKAALINGTDPSTLKCLRCDSVATAEELGDVGLNTNFTVHPCSSWHNSTFADPSVFAGINTTDSDMLLPRNLGRTTVEMYRTSPFALNGYRTSFGTSLTLNTTIRDGMVVQPHETGFKIVFGVPSLRPHQSATLERAMSLEVEVGCMSVGIFSSHDPRSLSSNGFDYFAETDDWRAYEGPEYFRDVLSSTADRIRKHYSPLFNTSSEGGYRTINSTISRKPHYTESPYIDSFFLPPLDDSNLDDTEHTLEAIGNCTEQLWTQLQLDRTISGPDFARSASICQPVILTDMAFEDGGVSQRAARMVCAASNQVNLVSGVVSVSAEGQVDLNSTRLPSHLNQLYADYYDIVPNGTTLGPSFPNETVYVQFEPILRFTLVDNSSGSTSHFIHNQRAALNGYGGTGSPGNILASVVSAIFDFGDLAHESHANLGAQLSLSEAGLGPKSATRWFGQTGASFILNSLTYNGWVAAASPAVAVSDTAGPIGTCYRSAYTVGFIPLVAAIFIIALWMIFLLVTHGLSGVRKVGESYGGLKPNWDAVCPNADALLIWENDPRPHLRLVSPGQAHDAAGSSTAAEHLSSTSKFAPEPGKGSPSM